MQGDSPFGKFLPQERTFVGIRAGEKTVEINEVHVNLSFCENLLQLPFSKFFSSFKNNW
jgi:hypothetical protein